MEFKLNWKNNVNRFSFKKLKLFLAPTKKVVKKHPILFFFIIFWTILAAVSQAWMVKLVQLIIDDILNVDKFYLFNYYLSWKYLLILVALNFILVAASEFGSDYFGQQFSLYIEINVRIDTLKSLVEKDISYYSKNKIGLIMSKIVTDSEQLGSGVNDFVLNALYSISMFFSCYAVLFSLDWKLSLFSLLYTIVIWALTIWAFVYMRRWSIIARDIRTEVDGYFTDRIINVKLIKATGTELYETKEFAKSQELYNWIKGKYVQWNALLSLFAKFFSYAMTPLLTVFGLLYYKNDLSANLGTIVAFISTSMKLAGPIAFTDVTLRALTKASNSAFRIENIIAVPTLIDVYKNQKTISKITSVDFKNINFNYPEKPEIAILKNINFLLEKGKSYAFVGPSGSGKSSVSRLLIRNYDPTVGNITINNHYDLTTQLNLESYLDHIGYVEQETQIFYGTIYENICYPDPTAFKKEQVFNAAKMAQLHDFIMSLPNNYGTIIGERGTLLSGGQKQRLSLARMFLKNADMLVMDEPTSSLDYITERKIQVEIENLYKNKIVVIIAHRLSTIRNVDKIFFLKDGVIIESGTFAELMELKNNFYNLYQVNK